MKKKDSAPRKSLRDVPQSELERVTGGGPQGTEPGSGGPNHNEVLLID